MNSLNCSSLWSSPTKEKNLAIISPPISYLSLITHPSCWLTNLLSLSLSSFFTFLNTSFSQGSYSHTFTLSFTNMYWVPIIFIYIAIKVLFQICKFDHVSTHLFMELVMDRKAWRAAVCGSQRVGHDWVTELNWPGTRLWRVSQTKLSSFLTLKVKGIHWKNFKCWSDMSLLAF